MFFLVHKTGCMQLKKTVNVCLNQLSEKGQDQESKANPVTIIDLFAVIGTDGIF